MHFLLLHHPKIPQSLELAQQWAAQFEELGARASILPAWEEAEIARHVVAHRRLGEPGSRRASRMPTSMREGESNSPRASSMPMTMREDQVDLVITLGGDGTILRAARACAPARVPILGVKMGRVGFLSEITPEQFNARALIDGTYWIEERTMLHASCTRNGTALGSFEALNDVVVGRGKLARVIRLTTFIDGDYLTTFVADGAIVATATGSTAYGFASGGPILAPEVKTLVLVPIAPYLSQIKSLVLPEGSRVLFRLQTDHRAILTIDGQIDVELESGDEVSVAASKHVARFARLRPRTYFYRTLVERLRERGANEREGDSK